MTYREMAGITTSFHVERWNADQVAWVLRKAGVADDPRIKNTRSLLIPPTVFRGLGVKPYSVTHDYDCNMIVQAGWVNLFGGIAGTTITNKFSSSFGRIGVGTSVTAAAYADTKLGGDTGSASTTSYYMTCGAAPTIATSSSPPSLTWTATFGTGVANFAWNEFGTDNYNTAGVTTQSLANVVFINHGISPQGTKSSGQIWTATEVLTFGVPTGSGTVG